MESEELSEAEVRQLRVLYSLHLNPMITGTWQHGTIAALTAKGLTRESESGFPELTEEGLALARTL